MCYSLWCNAPPMMLPAEGRQHHFRHFDNPPEGSQRIPVGRNTGKIVMLIETSNSLYDYQLKDFSEKLIVEKLRTEIATLVNSTVR